MKFELEHAFHSFLKLFKFLFWYGAVVAAVFMVLPLAGSILQEQYEALSGTARMAAVAGFFLVVAGWYLVGQKKRLVEDFAKDIELSGE